MSRVLMKGNDAIGAGAIAANCRYYYGYPITPQNEIGEYMSSEMPKVGGVFIQAESEVAAINMVYGTSATGARVMTSSSGPGISLKMEGISYIAAAELPCVIVNIMRGGPGLGNIAPSQSDYFQATKGGGHGDYRLIVLAPSSVQEIYDFTRQAFYLADKYRIPAIILGDGFLGQMMEVVELADSAKDDEYARIPEKPWAITGCKGREKNIVNTLLIEPDTLEKHNWKLKDKYQQIAENEKRADLYRVDDAEILVAAFGISARISKEAVDMARDEGIKVGLIRPITLWPFPDHVFKNLDSVKGILTVEMNTGQMIEDVRLSVEGKIPVEFYGRTGGNLPDSTAIFEEIKRMGGM